MIQWRNDSIPQKLGSVINNRQLSQSLADLGRQLIGSESPAPVSAARGRQVHARFAAQPKNILQGSDDDIGDGSQEATDKRPVDFPAVRSQVLERELSFEPDVLQCTRAVAGAAGGPPA